LQMSVKRVGNIFDWPFPQGFGREAHEKALTPPRPRRTPISGVRVVGSMVDCSSELSSAAEHGSPAPH
jgi:hypothetical protein